MRKVGLVFWCGFFFNILYYFDRIWNARYQKGESHRKCDEFSKVKQKDFHLIEHTVIILSSFIFVFSFSMFSQFSHTFFFPAIENVNEVMYHHLVGYKAGSSDLIRLQVH